MSRRPAWIALALVALTAVVYAPVRHFGFLKWDDQGYITDNVHVLSGLSWRSVGWALTTGHQPYWQPVTWLSHLLDVQIFGLNAGAHHVESVALHALTSCLLFLVLRRLTAADWKSAFVAALFAVHPLHVESVAWIAERKDVLSALFLVLTIGAYARYVERPSGGRYAVVFAWSCLALAAKPMAVTLPVLLILIDVWPLRRRPTLADKIPFALAAVATGVITLAVQQRLGLASLALFPLPLRVANAVTSYGAYALKVLWPVHLAAFYPWTWTIAWPAVAASAAWLIATSAFVWRERRTRPYLAAGWLWFLVTLLPVIGVVQSGEQAMADRFMYVPAVGLFIMIAWGVPDAWAAWRLPRPILPALAAAAVIACAGVAAVQVRYWADDVTLWRHAVAATSHNALAEDLLGLALKDRGDWEGAKASYLRALDEVPPAQPDLAAMIQSNLGLVFVEENRPSEAIARYESALRVKPDLAEAHDGLGRALVKEGHIAEAMPHIEEALRIDPEYAAAHNDFGTALALAGRPGEAVPQYTEALRIDPKMAEAENGLGAALAMEGDPGSALPHYAAAVRLDPTLAIAHANLAAALIQRGEVQQAIVELQQALRLDRHHAAWHFNLAVLLMKTGQARQAADELDEALQIDPSFEPARRARAALPDDSHRRR